MSTGGKAIEVDHSLPSSAEVKNEWSHISTPPIRVYGVDSDNAAFVIPSLCHAHKVSNKSLPSSFDVGNLTSPRYRMLLIQ